MVSSERADDEAVRARALDLLARLSPAEKAGQLTQYFYFGGLSDADAGDGPPPSQQAAAVEAALARGEVGSLLFVTDPAETNRLQRLAVQGNRHGIPVLFGYDVIHGLRTVFPVPVAMAASWDPAAVEAGQAVAAREARAVGIQWTFAPMVDIARDPRWGRIVEGAGEDPHLGAAMAAAQVRGFQGDGTDLGADSGRVLATAKHFAAYGAALGGRDYEEADVSDAALWNVYLPPFEAAVAAGAGSVMTAYMPLNGIPATANRWLLRDVLRGAWDFDGFVVSDANAVKNLQTHGVALDPAEAAALALGAGCDMEMAMADAAYGTLEESVAAGRVDLADLDAAVLRVLEAKVRLGLLDNPYVDETRAAEVLADPAHRAAARTAAQRSFVLLRNEGDLLPLRAEDLRRVAVLGPLADSARDTLGPWCFDHDLAETVTVHAGLREALREAGVAVEHAPGVRPYLRPTPSIFDAHGGNQPTVPEDFDDDAELERAVDLARDAGVAVVVVGEWQNLVGEQASRSSLDLPGRQLELLQAVVATGTPVVLLVMSGRPVDLRWAVEHVPAIVQVWYPGSQGGAAVADLLLGAVPPGGRLPFSWPRTVGHAPVIAGHQPSFEPENQDARYWDSPSTPLFPFGHGLGYAPVEYGSLAVGPAETAVGGTVTVQAVVRSTGSRTTDEVVQVYLRQRHGSASLPVRRLVAFERVTLAPGEERRLDFEVGPRHRRHWNAAVRDWVEDATSFDVLVGGSSVTALEGTFRTTAT
ncbi:glycoside hydrolase family 3 N-terminal domain-containing protein [Aquipuribacter sp. SD81]|uniref:glycoside hydrolase family 3 N-terminal domain-containing protein n=1 Tax=Aquipuribacter sp. SD81 TaxID=3127703 RepID=UPI0030176F92